MGSCGHCLPQQHATRQAGALRRKAESAINGLLRPREDECRRHPRRPAIARGIPVGCCPSRTLFVFSPWWGGLAVSLHPSWSRTRHLRGPTVPPPRVCVGENRLVPDQRGLCARKIPPSQPAQDQIRLCSSGNQCPLLTLSAHALPALGHHKPIGYPGRLFLRAVVRRLALNSRERRSPRRRRTRAERNPEPKKPSESEPDWPGGAPDHIRPQLPLVDFFSCREASSRSRGCLTVKTSGVGGHALKSFA